MNQCPRQCYALCWPPKNCRRASHKSSSLIPVQPTPHSTGKRLSLSVRRPPATARRHFPPPLERGASYIAETQSPSCSAELDARTAAQVAHIPVQNADVAVCRIQKPGNHRKQCCLAASARTHKQRHLANGTSNSTPRNTWTRLSPDPKSFVMPLHTTAEFVFTSVLFVFIITL